MYVCENSQGFYVLDTFLLCGKHIVIGLQGQPVWNKAPIKSLELVR